MLIDDCGELDGNGEPIVEVGGADEAGEGEGAVLEER